MGSVVALAGQVGGAKLADGLYRLRGEALTVVVNTGDDYEHLGLAFSPDVDTMLYTLAGIASPSAGWEPEGETHAVHGFQYAGADSARITDEVMSALHAPDLEAVVICPANPYHVIRPILEIEGMKELLRKRRAPVIAVTPIVGGRALKGSAAKMMRELDRELSARSVAGEYLRIIDGFVLDSEDLALVEGVRSLGMDVVALPTIMRSIDDRVALAQEVLDFAAAIRVRLQAEVE